MSTENKLSYNDLEKAFYSSNKTIATLEQEITVLKAENAELTQSELECRQLYNEFVGDLNATRIKNTELESEVATLKTELEELWKTYTLESGGPY